jgi:HEAT repeat protein
MSTRRDKPLLPLPRLTTLLVAALGLAVGWAVWRSMEQRQQQEDFSRLKDALRNPEATVQERLQSIELWVADGAKSVPVLLAEMDNPSPEVRAAATTALARIRPHSEESVSAVLRSLDDPAPEVRLAAVAGLRGWREHRVLDIQPYVPRLIRHMKDPDATIREDAFAIVAQSRGDPAIGAALTELTNSASPAMRGRGAQLIRDLSTWDDGALAAMRRLLRDADASVRDEAFHTLIASGRFTLQDVLTGLESGGESTVGLACRALEAFEPEEAAIATGRLRELLRSENLKISALETLAAIGIPARQAVPEVLQLLAGPDEKTLDMAAYTRCTALFCLTRICRDKSLVVARLREGLFSPNRDTSRLAGELLLEFSPEDARESVPFLLRALSESRRADQVPLMMALGGLGSAAAAAVPALLDRLDSEVPYNRWVNVGYYATDALGRIGPAAAKAVPALVAALEAELRRAKPRKSEVFALYRIGVRSELAERVLIRFIQQELAGIRREWSSAATPEEQRELSARIQFLATAVLALGRVGQGSPAAHETVCQVLRFVLDVEASDSWYARRVYWALADLQTRSEQTFTLLLNALRPRDVDPQDLSTGDSLQSPRRPEEGVCIAAIRGLGLFPDCADRSVPCLAELLQDEDRRVQIVAARALGHLGEAARPAIPALNALAAAPDARRPRSTSPRWIMWERDRWIDPVHEFERALAYDSPRDAARSALARIERAHEPVAAPRP